MISLIKYLSEIIGQILGLFYSPKLTELVEAVCSHIYTGMLKRRFAHFGKDSVLACKALNLKGLQYIKIGSNVMLSKNIQLTAWHTGAQAPSIIIGDRCNIRENCHITACNSITIGKNLLTGTNVLITDNSHGTFDKDSLNFHPEERPVVSKGSVVIGDNVWLANNVCVLPGVTIGDGVCIGANSVVTHDIPAYSIAVGIPAKVIKTAAV